MSSVLLSQPPHGASRFDAAVASSPPAAAATASELAERTERDLAGFRIGLGHRLWMAGALGLVLAVPIALGIFAVPLWLLGAIIGCSLGLNGAIAWVTDEHVRGRWRPWYRYAIPAADVQ